MSEELKTIVEAISSNLTDLEMAALLAAKLIGEAKQEEYKSKRDAVTAKTALASTEATVKRNLFDSGLIDGRNAETRKAQLDAAMNQTRIK